MGKSAGLTKSQIKTVQPRAKDFRLSDGRGLVLMARSSGTKSWVLRFKRDGRDTVVTLGHWPELSLEDARTAAESLRSARRQGIVPAIDMGLETIRRETGSTFAEVAKAYMRREAAHWAPGHLQRFQNRMERDVYRSIGDTTVGDVEPVDVARALRPIEARGAQDTAVRVVGMIGQVMRFAVARGLRRDDPTQHLRGGLDRPPPPRHRPAATEPAQVGQLLAAIDGWRGGSLAKPFLQLCGYLFQRPGEIAAMRWDGVDLEQAVWAYQVV